MNDKIPPTRAHSQTPSQYPQVDQEQFSSDNSPRDIPVQPPADTDLRLLRIQRRKKRLEIELLNMEISERKIFKSSYRNDVGLREVNFYNQGSAINEEDSDSFEYFTQEQLEGQQENNVQIKMPQILVEEEKVEIKKSRIQEEEEKKFETHLQNPHQPQVEKNISLLQRSKTFLMSKTKIKPISTMAPNNPREKCEQPIPSKTDFQDMQNTEVQMNTSQISGMHSRDHSQANFIMEQDDHLANMKSLQIPEKQLVIKKKKVKRKKQKSKKSSRRPSIQSSRLTEINQSQIVSEKPHNCCHRPHAPPQPKIFLDHGPVKNAGGILANSNEEEDEKNGFFWEPISYKKLMKVISTLHPVDPETKRRFNIQDRVTIKHYISKITDLCFCYWIGQRWKEVKKWFRKKFRGNNNKIFIRPESMVDEPDSGSCNSSDTDDQEVSDCSQALGDGATLYLQTMNTFIIMFAILVFINIPIYVLYEGNTDGNDLGSFESVFKYFSIGNLGQMTKRCGWSDFYFKFEKQEETHADQVIAVDCGAGYVGELQAFGFLYTIDKLYGGKSDGQATCDHIEDPRAPYKIPPPIVYNCDPELFFDDDELAICVINKALQDQTITQAEAEIQLEKLKPSRKLQEADDPYFKVWDYQSVQAPEEFETDQEIGNEINFDPICSYNPKKRKQGRLFKTKDAMAKFDDYFDEQCFYKNKCNYDFKQVGYKLGEVDEDGFTVDEDGIGLFGLISDECKLRISHPDFLKITSSLYIGVMGCKYDDVKMPFTDKRIHKEKIGVITVAIDFASIMIMIFFFSKIQDINDEFLNNIDDLRVQMKDFGVKLNKVRLDKFTFDSRVIKLKVWHYFTEILKHEADNFNDMSCIDVCLSLYTQPNIQCVFRMQEIQLEINKINIKLCSNQFKNEEIPDKQEELKELLIKQKRFEVRYQELCAKPIKQKNQNLMVQRVPKNLRIKQIQYIFVVFKNCETSQVVLDKFKKEGVALKCIKKCLPMEKVQTESKLLFGKPIDLEGILEPDEIIWENLGYTGAQQQARRYAINVFSIFFLIFNTLFTMYLSGFSFFMNKNIPDAIGCPDVSITKREAYVDLMKDLDDDKTTESQGLMGCYCKDETSMWLPWTLVNNNFAEYSDLNKFIEGDDKQNYCLKWWLLRWIKELVMFFVSTSAVFINEIVANVFQRLGQFQKMHTKVEEQTTCFRQIFIQEFINMGIILLITSFDSLGIRDKLLGQLSDSSTVYDGFEPNWYMDQGNKLCVMIFMSSFLVNSTDVSSALKAFFWRFYDRNFRFNVKLDPDDDYCDLPNTKKRVQSDLENLYTGCIFNGEKAFSRMMSTMFVIQTYSGGMPILYLIGLIFYSVTLLANKFLLIYYYQKSRTLTKHIPIFTSRLLKYGLLMHLIFSCFMLTNPDAFKTQNQFDGMGNLRVGELKSIDEQLQNVGVSESNSEQSFGQIIKERTLYYHQQLFFIILVMLIMTYFLGLSFYTMLYYIAMFIFNFIKRLIQKIAKNIKDVAQQITEKKRREKKKVQKAMKQEMDKKVEEKIRENKEIEDQQNQLFDYEFNKTPQGTDATQQRNILIINQLQNFKKQQELKELQRQQQQHDLDGDGIIDEEELALMEAKKQAEIEARKILQQKRQARPDYSDNIYQEFSTENLSNLYERSKRELTDFWDMFQYDQEIGEELLSPESTSPYRTLFLETLYAYRITVDECLWYQEFLIQRQKDIEQTIDKYFELLQPVLVQKMREKFDKDRAKRKKDGKEGTLKDQVQQRKYEDWYVKYSDDAQFKDNQYYPYVRKMKLLVEFQDELIQADKDRKENRNGVQNICRMTGSLSQSYFIFDAQQFKVGRKIYYSIDANQEDNQDLGNSDEKEEKEENETKPKESLIDMSENSDFISVISENSSENSKSQAKYK